MAKKKIVCFFIVFVVLIQGLFFSSCSNGWELVSSITITTNGETKTFSSGCSDEFGMPIDITKEEYTKNRKNRDLDKDDNRYIKKLSISKVADIIDGGTSYSYQEKEMKGYWYYMWYGWSSGNVFYAKKPYIETIYTLTYVKILNDTTIKIKSSKGETTYTVTSYSIREAPKD